MPLTPRVRTSPPEAVDAAGAAATPADRHAARSLAHAHTWQRRHRQLTTLNLAALVAVLALLRVLVTAPTHTYLLDVAALLFLSSFCAAGLGFRTHAAQVRDVVARARPADTDPDLARDAVVWRGGAFACFALGAGATAAFLAVNGLR